MLRANRSGALGMKDREANSRPNQSPNRLRKSDIHIRTCAALYKHSFGVSYDQGF